MKRCPNCGACQECGHAPTPMPRPWFGPYYVPYTQPIWWQSPYQVMWGGSTQQYANSTSPQTTGGTFTSYSA